MQFSSSRTLPGHLWERKNFNGRRGNSFDVLAHLAAVFQQKMIGQQNHIATALAQRRQVDRENIQPVE